MVAHVATVAFLGLEARSVEVQVQIAAGLPKFLVVGLPDKAVGESRERVHAALAAIGLSLPPKRITINLSPADPPGMGPDLAQVKGQETAKRALEIAASGGHNMLMVGPPGAGKSLLAACLPGILPDLTPSEALGIM